MARTWKVQVEGESQPRYYEADERWTQHGQTALILRSFSGSTMRVRNVFEMPEDRVLSVECIGRRT